MTGKAVATLLIHGDKDLLVPIEHRQKMLAALEKEKVPWKLVIVKGAGHGFSPGAEREGRDPALMGWFEKHLKVGKKPEPHTPARKTA